MANIVVLTEKPAKFDYAEEQEQQKGSEDGKLDERCPAFSFVTPIVHDNARYLPEGRKGTTLRAGQPRTSLLPLAGTS